MDEFVFINRLSFLFLRYFSNALSPSLTLSLNHFPCLLFRLIFFFFCLFFVDNHVSSCSLLLLVLLFRFVCLLAIISIFWVIFPFRFRFYSDMMQFFI